jgi:hypothetical protein
MPYLIVRNSDGAFVARSGNPGSYTRDITRAAIYTTRALAAGNCCGNEHARDVADLLSHPEV